MVRSTQEARVADGIEVKQIGLFQRIRGAILGVGIGLMMMVAAVPLMFWNEWTAVSAYQALQEGAGLVVSVSADRVDPGNEGKLVRVAAPLTVPGALDDPIFGVKAPKATRLRRTVEMYQWKENKKTETRKKVGGGEERVTTYTYEQVWSDKPLKSDAYDDRNRRNPPKMPFSGETFDQPSATLGAFSVDGRLLKKLTNFEHLKLPADAAKKVRPGSASGLTVHEGALFRGNPSKPEIGDVRIRFQQAPATTTTIVARQAGKGFAPYQTRNGRELEFVRVGDVPAAKVFEDAVSANTIATWCVRFAGFLMLFLGFRALFGPLAVLTDIVPFAGRIVRTGLTALAFFVSTPLTLLIVALAWIVARPLLGIFLLLVAGAFGMGLLLLLIVAWRRKAE